MERDFPHLGDTAFPHLSNVDVWQYRNNFDYSRWEDNARIKLCTVNWDVDYNNVVNWESDKARDAYFDGLKGCKVDEPTMFQVQPDGTVKVPVPFNAATQFNYLVLDYPVMPTQENPVSYAAPARSRYLYFCEALEELSPNTTLCHVQLDVWSTYINSVDVSGMMLARGHAPMAKITAETYLANPYANQAMLTAPDVTFGTFARTPAVKSHVFNGEVLAVVTMTGNGRGAWGSKSAGTWQVPAATAYQVDGTPAMLAMAVQPDNLVALLDAMKSQTPQAFQTIRAVWFAPAELVTLGGAYTFAGVSVYPVQPRAWRSFDVPSWSKDDFGYPEKCSDMAKLYTYPYARVLAHAEGGDIEIKIEETEGNISVAAKLNLVGPFISVDTYVRLGGGSASLSFASAASLSMPWAGDALRTLRSLEIPSFAVYLDAGKRNDYGTHFDRAQAQTALQNTYVSAKASNATANSNALSTAVAGRDNAVDGADAAFKTAQASSNTSYASTGSANVYAANQFSNAAEQQAASMAQSVVQSFASLNRQLEVNTMQMATSATQNLVMGAVAGGPAGAAAGAAGAVFSGLSLATTISNNAAYVNDSAKISGDYMTAMYGGSMIVDNPGSFNAMFNSYTGASVDSLVGISQFRTREQNSAQNTLSRKLNQAQRQNSRSLVKGGSGYITDESGEVSASGTFQGTAVRSYNNAVSTANATKATADANAERARETAQSAISNQIKQAALDAPLEAGAFANAGSAATRPLGWVFEVQTQDTGSIMAAASHFARYGYALGQYWDLTSWQVMRYFTYWQCDDVWIVPSACPQGAASLIRSVLINGTTVWREPAIIGAIDIWEN